MVVRVFPEHEYPVVATVGVVHVVGDDPNDPESSTEVESDLWVLVLATFQAYEGFRRHATGELVVPWHPGAEIDTLLVRFDDSVRDAGLNELISCFGAFGHREIKSKGTVAGVIMSSEHAVRTCLEPACGSESAGRGCMDDAQCSQDLATCVLSAEQQVWAGCKLGLHLLWGPEVLFRDRRGPCLRIDSDKVRNELLPVGSPIQERLNTGNFDGHVMASGR